jgi:hypothetical protein
VTGDEEAEKYVGYGSVRDGAALGSEITNGELVLIKRPYSEQAKVWADQEKRNRMHDNKANSYEGADTGAPITAEITVQRAPGTPSAA